MSSARSSRSPPRLSARRCAAGPPCPETHLIRNRGRVARRPGGIASLRCPYTSIVVAIRLWPISFERAARHASEATTVAGSGLLGRSRGTRWPWPSDETAWGPLHSVFLRGMLAAVHSAARAANPVGSGRRPGRGARRCAAELGLEAEPQRAAATAPSGSESVDMPAAIAASSCSDWNVRLSPRGRGYGRPHATRQRTLRRLPLPQSGPRRSAGAPSCERAPGV